MAFDRPFLSIIIPAYNEEKRIGKTLLAIEAYLKDKPYDAEVLVVSGGSTDGTVRVVEDYAKMLKGLRCIAKTENRGKGFVVREGMREARGALRLFTDADNATPIEELDKLLPFVKIPAPTASTISRAFLAVQAGDFDVVFGSIGLKESRVEKGESGIRTIAGKLSNLLIQALVLPGIHDTQRGFKLFTAEAAEAIFPKMKIDRWGFDIEALALARKMGFRIKEVPIHWIHDPDSKVGFKAYLQTLRDLLRIRWWLWTNAHRERKPKP